MNKDHECRKHFKAYGGQAITSEAFFRNGKRVNLYPYSKRASIKVKGFCTVCGRKLQKAFIIGKRETTLNIL